MSIEQDAWTQLKTQLQADVTLAAYITTFYFTRKAKIFDAGYFPLLIAYPISVIESDEGWVGTPKQKIVNLVISMNGKVRNVDGPTLETEILKADEYLKNAVEANLQLTNKATIADMSDSTFTFLDDNIAETNFTINIKVPRFTAGLR